MIWSGGWRGSCPGLDKGDSVERAGTCGDSRKWKAPSVGLQFWWRDKFVMYWWVLQRTEHKISVWGWKSTQRKSREARRKNRSGKILRRKQPLWTKVYPLFILPHLASCLSYPCLATTPLHLVVTINSLPLSLISSILTDKPQSGLHTTLYYLPAPVPFRVVGEKHRVLF